MLAGVSTSTAQYDSSYIEEYRGYLVGRFLANRKYASMTVVNRSRDYTLRYTPNKTFSAGLGASYRFATLNLAFGMLEPHHSRGKTRSLDLQIHRYGRKFTTDLLVQFFKGFYLADRRYALPGEDFYVRPDIASSSIGGNFQYVLNHRKFSYRAVFQQTEFQKKSAGSFLLGVEAYVGRFKGDSTVVPSGLTIDGDSETMYKMRYFEFGPNAGYAYTWVYKKIFVTATGSVSLNASINRYFEENNTTTNIGVSPNSLIRFSTGYNTQRWGANVLVIATALRFPKFQDHTFLFSTGRYRLNLIYRFIPSKKTKRFLRYIDKVDERILGRTQP
jgi:hypothetical protein